MNNIKYDLKLSDKFSGTISYVKYDYLDDKKIDYDLSFHEGKLKSVIMWVDGNSDVIPHEKWNEEFWLKAPKYANFDTCRWKREWIIVKNDQSCLSTDGLTILYSHLHA